VELHGTIIENLRMAISSAERLRGRAVYKDTLAYWHDLLHEARRARSLAGEADGAHIERLIAQLELELAERPR
jgi:hypothetical protein